MDALSINLEALRRKQRQQTFHIAVKRQIAKEKAVAYKGGECIDCGKTFPVCCMDFHHVTSSKKEKYLRLTSLWARVQRDLDKCVLLCANCHRIRHYRKR